MLNNASVKKYYLFKSRAKAAGFVFLFFYDNIKIMSELVLYRKYRPKEFDEVIGQEHVVESLQNAFRTNRVAHAYLFSGPRGVGKTTVARLIAKALNCEAHDNVSQSLVGVIKKNPLASGVFEGKIPCNICDSCRDFNNGRALDVIEIDAASSRGIDDIRELREGVRFVPTRSKFKTYIIDETHMLTKEAFNALLKTLEEPPAHAVFVLATTELEKVPATIVSRTQHYDFRRPSVAQIAERLGMIAKKERVALDGDAARLIALAAEGSMRDAESILGQIMAAEDKKITRAEIERILGLPKREAAKKMFELVSKKDASSALALIQELHDAGHDLQYFSKLMLQYFRNALYLKTDPSLVRFVENELLPDEIDVINAYLHAYAVSDLVRAADVIFTNLQSFKKSPISQLPLELTVLELIGSSK